MTTTTGGPAPSVQDAPAGLAVAGRPTSSRRKGEPRPVPVKKDGYAHLTIDALREYRTALAAEENRVSYWRRILQARLDVVSAGGREVDHERLAPVLATERVGAGRTALVQVVPADDIPPLPELAELWERRVEDGDEDGRERFAADLRAAEGELSAYRSALHARIGEATGELIARYREQPALCLTALPLAPRRATA